MTVSHPADTPPWRRVPDGGALRLLALVCADAASGARACEISAKAAGLRDWDRLLALVARHRVAGLAHAALSRVEGVPEGVRRKLAADASTIAHASLRAAGETIRLQQAFEAEGLEAIFFKGAALGQLAYGNLAIKHSKDIDFLVPREDVRRCVALLERLGYRLHSPRAALGRRRWQAVLDVQIEVEMMRPGTGLQVEPHWALSENRSLLEPVVLAARAGKEFARIGEVPVRGFHPDDLFVYLCVHGARSAWYRLKWLADLHGLIRLADAREIARLHRHAQDQGAGPSARIALSLCATLFALPVPAEILDRANAVPAMRAFLSLCLADLASTRPIISARHDFVMKLLWAACQRHLFRELHRWSVGTTDPINLPLPRGLHALYPLLRLPSMALRKLLAVARPTRSASGRGVRDKDVAASAKSR